MSFDDLHNKPVVHIRNWWVEEGRLHGEVYGHPGNANGQFPDGSPIVTSPIKEMKLDRHVIETLNTVYHLEGPFLNIKKVGEPPAPLAEADNPLRPLKVYISGPITGKPNLNREAFDREEAFWRNRGFDVFNPQSIPAPKAGLTAKQVWQYYMRKCIAALLLCAWIVMLPGWDESDGAHEEHRIARMLGLTIRFSDDNSSGDE